VLWDTSNWAEIRRLAGVSQGAMLGTQTLAFSPDGKRLATGGGMFGVVAQVWDIQTGEAVSSLRGHGLAIGAIAFSPDGKTVATGSDDRTVRLWHADTGIEQLVLATENEKVTALAFTPDSTTLISGTGRDLRMRNLQASMPVRLWRGAGDAKISHELARWQQRGVIADRISTAARTALPQPSATTTIPPTRKD
jgi:WD40 repeat protein